MSRYLASALVAVLALSMATPAWGEMPFDSWTYRDRARIEVGFGGGGVTNDPFLDRGYATWRVVVHLHDVVAVDARFLASPNGGERDRTAVVRELEQRNEVVPDLSRILFGFTPGVLLTPLLHAEDDAVAAFDLSFFVGGGVLQTQDDEELVQGGEERYRLQALPAFRWGVTIRVKLFDWFTFAAHPTFLYYTEQVSRAEGLNNQLKQPFLLTFEFSALSPSWAD